MEFHQLWKDSLKQENTGSPPGQHAKLAFLLFNYGEGFTNSSNYLKNIFFKIFFKALIKIQKDLVTSSNRSFKDKKEDAKAPSVIPKRRRNENKKKPITKADDNKRENSSTPVKKVGSKAEYSVMPWAPEGPSGMSGASLSDISMISCSICSSDFVKSW